MVRQRGVEGAAPYEGNSVLRMEVRGMRVLRRPFDYAQGCSGRRVLCFSLSFSAELVGRGLAPAVQDTVGIRIGLRRIRTGYRSGGTKAPPYNGNSVWRMEVGGMRVLRRAALAQDDGSKVEGWFF